MADLYYYNDNTSMMTPCYLTIAHSREMKPCFPLTTDDFFLQIWHSCRTCEETNIKKYGNFYFHRSSDTDQLRLAL